MVERADTKAYSKVETKEKIITETRRDDKVENKVDKKCRKIV